MAETPRREVGEGGNDLIQTNRGQANSNVFNTVTVGMYKGKKPKKMTIEID